VVDDIIARWKDYIATRIRDDMVHNYFQDLAPIILEYAGSHRCHDTNWIPPLDWKNAGQINGVYLDWKKKKKKTDVESVLFSADVKHDQSKGIYTPLETTLESEETVEAGEAKIMQKADSFKV